MKSLHRLFFIIALLTGAGLIPARAKPIPFKNIHSRQLMVVVTNNWSSLQGRLYCFKKQHGKWVPQFSNAIVVGAKGLGVGNGIVPLTIPNAPVKKEGDNKAPAGIFTVGTAFGYAAYNDARWIKNHYVMATDTVICVDDAQSAHYNTLVKTDTTASDWHSHENMHLKSDAYKWGLFINHNAGKPVPGNGSCIFMHIWSNSEQGTSGCTAMPEADILRVLHWINAKDNPLLVQLPKAQYVKLRARFGLPEIKF